MLASSSSHHVAVLKDVFFSWDYRPLVEHSIAISFYKFTAEASPFFHVFLRAMFDTPWMFAYRDIAEILMSQQHLRMMRQETNNPKDKVCFSLFAPLQQE
jgi:hypothetical protein